MKRLIEPILAKPTSGQRDPLFTQLTDSEQSSLSGGSQVYPVPRGLELGLGFPAPAPPGETPRDDDQLPDGVTQQNLIDFLIRVSINGGVYR